MTGIRLTPFEIDSEARRLVSVLMKRWTISGFQREDPRTWSIKAMLRGGWNFVNVTCNMAGYETIDRERLLARIIAYAISNYGSWVLPLNEDSLIVMNIDRFKS